MKIEPIHLLYLNIHKFIFSKPKLLDKKDEREKIVEFHKSFGRRDYGTKNDNNILLNRRIF